MTLTEFLTARIAETEAAANACSDWPECDPDYGCKAHPAPARLLAECEAKRQRIAHYERISRRSDGGMLEREEYVLAEGAVRKQLMYDAAVHADHPDYREEWRP